MGYGSSKKINKFFVTLYKMSLTEIALLLDIADADSAHLFLYFLLSMVICVTLLVACSIGCLCFCPERNDSKSRRRPPITPLGKEHIV